MAAGCSDKGNRSNGNAFVDNRDAEFPGDGVGRGCEFAGTSEQFLPDVLTSGIKVGAYAVEQADTHGHSPDVKIVMTDHVGGLEDLFYIDHNVFRFCKLSRVSDSVHHVEDLLFLAADIDSDFRRHALEPVDEFVIRDVNRLRVNNHHHVEDSHPDGLGNIEDICIVLKYKGTDPCNDACGVFSDNRNYCFVHFIFIYPSIVRK